MTDLEGLYHKFLDRQCARKEAEYLLQYFQQQPDTEQITALIQTQLDSELELPSSTVDEAVIARNRQKLQESIVSPVRGKRMRPQNWGLVAAAILVLLSISLYFILYQQPIVDPVLTSQYGGDVSPGGNRAYISLSNGQNIELDSTQTGLVTTTDGMHTYADGTELLSGSEAQFATIHTPVGGEYQLTLPDGTKAWLNAASSLTYPVRFSGTQREVEIEGEVYLEVAKVHNKPFIVHSEGQRIQVLGTAFNVRSYDAKTVTTLLHGKIALINQTSDQRSVLMPGQQASVTGENTRITQVDAADFIAWKDGYIMNTDADILQVCRELERWYNVKFIFPSGFTNKERAVISLDRHAMLSALLLSLEKTYGVQFSINGKEVRVN